MQPLKIYKFTLDLDKYWDLEVPTLVFWRESKHLFDADSGFKRQIYEPELDMDNPFSIYLETNNPAFADGFAKLIGLPAEEVAEFDSSKFRNKF